MALRIEYGDPTVSEVSMTSKHNSSEELHASLVEDDKTEVAIWFGDGERKTVHVSANDAADFAMALLKIAQTAAVNAKLQGTYYSEMGY